MADRFTGCIVFEVAFGNVGHVRITVDQYVVPGFVFWWPALCNLFIPLIAASIFSIDIYDDATVIKLFMMDALANEEEWVIHNASWWTNMMPNIGSDYFKCYMYSTHLRELVARVTQMGENGVLFISAILQFS